LLELGVDDDSSVERLRERQEAAGNGLNNQNGRGGCLLFARRNGSMLFLISCLGIGLSAVVHSICREMAGHGGPGFWVIYVCCLSGAG
jgi:hypothetical protein